MILWFFLLGFATGMRTMTAMAVLTWFAWTGLLPQHGWSFWVGSLITVIVFTLCALGEYVGDTLPMTPNRTDPPLLAARCAFGILVGALAAHALQEPWAGGMIFALLGVLVGAFGGVRLRLWAAKQFGRDLPAALLESAFALACALFAAYKLHVALSLLA